MAIDISNETNARRYWDKINQAIVNLQEELRQDNSRIAPQTQSYSCNLFGLFEKYEDIKETPVLGPFFMNKQNKKIREQMNITTCNQSGPRRTINISLKSKVPEELLNKRRKSYSKTHTAKSLQKKMNDSEEIQNTLDILVKAV